MNIILKQQAAEFEGTSVPDFPLPIAVEPSSIFQEMSGTTFELDTVYFVTALYSYSDEFGDIFDLPETSPTPFILSTR